MARYAVINEQTNEVRNIIVWDGVSNWQPPVGHRVEEQNDVGIGDIWMDSIQDYVRPLKNLKPPEDEESIAQRQAAYEQAKAELKSDVFFVNLKGELEV